MFRTSAALVLLLATLAGCARVEASTPNSRLATPSLPCSLPYGTEVALLSPEPGSAAVSRNASLLFAASRDLPKGVAVVAVDGAGTASVPAALERVTQPAAKTAVPFADAVYYRAPGLRLQAHRQYTIALDDVAQNGCAPYAKLSGGDRFST